MVPGIVAAQSPSKINDFRLCPRLTFYKQVEKIKPPTKPSAARGTAIHNLVEGYLLYKNVPQGDSVESRAAIAAIPLLPPPPLPANDVEQWIRALPMLDSAYSINGKIDIVERMIRRITDLKTTSAPKWAKTKEQLRIDPQAILYAARYIEEWGTVRFRHLYTLTRAPFKAWPVEISLRPEYVKATIEQMIEQDFRPIQEILDHATHVSDVPHNGPVACKAYGGCFFLGKCEIANHTRVATATVITTRPTEDPMSKKKKANPYATAPATQAPPPAPAPAAASANNGSDTPTPKKKKANPYGTASAPTAATSAAPPTGMVKKKRKKQLTGTDINPPGEAAAIAEERGTDRPTIPKPPGTYKVAELRKILAPYVEDAKSRKKAELVALADEIFQVDASQAASVAPGSQTLNAPVAPQPSQIQQAVSDAVDAMSTGYSIFVDCIPVNTPYMALENILAPFQAQVAELSNDFERPSDLIPNHYGLIPFGKGNKQVAALLHSEIQAIKGNIVAWTRLPGTEAALEALIPHASLVVRAFR